MIFQCQNCGKENDIFEIHGRCGNCDNNRVEDFVIINNKKILSGMSGTNYQCRGIEILKSALNKEKIWVIDPKSKLM
ncbi:MULTISPECIES: hypothetical protein [Bacillus]|nr:MULTISPECIES: hypothetical protein [Bacillus]